MGQGRGLQEGFLCFRMSKGTENPQSTRPFYSCAYGTSNGPAGATRPTGRLQAREGRGYRSPEGLRTSRRDKLFRHDPLFQTLALVEQ
jgi:hypothetical protein